MNQANQGYLVRKRHDRRLVCGSVLMMWSKLLTCYIVAIPAVRPSVVVILYVTYMYMNRIAVLVIINISAMEM